MRCLTFCLNLSDDGKDLFFICLHLVKVKVIREWLPTGTLIAPDFCSYPADTICHLSLFRWLDCHCTTKQGFCLQRESGALAYSLSYLDISEYVHVRIGIADRSCRDSDSLMEISVPRTWRSDSWLLLNFLQVHRVCFCRWWVDQISPCSGVCLCQLYALPSVGNNLLECTSWFGWSISFR